jgi:hypothetical protein
MWGRYKKGEENKWQNVNEKIRKGKKEGRKVSEKVKIGSKRSK